MDPLVLASVRAALSHATRMTFAGGARSGYR